MAEHRLGNREECARILDALSEQIVRDGDVYEIFDLTAGGILKPVQAPPLSRREPVYLELGMFLEAAPRSAFPPSAERAPAPHANA